MPAPSTPPRRFRFGLRSLFMLVTMICVWFGYSMNWIRQRRAMLNEPYYFEPNTLEAESVIQAPGGLWLLGERGVVTLWVDEHNAERAGRLFPEAEIVTGPNPEDWSRLSRPRHH